MATNAYLMDIGEPVQFISDAIKQELGNCWPSQLERIVTQAIEHIFYGGILLGERVMERALLAIDISPVEAIMISRKAFEVLNRSLRIPGEKETHLQMAFEYRLFYKERAIAITRVRAKPVVDKRTPDDILEEITQCIDDGGFVPARLRRMLDEQRVHH